MAKKKRKSRKQNHPNSQGSKKNQVFVPKRDSEHRFPQMQRNSARGASRASGHSPRKK